MNLRNRPAMVAAALVMALSAISCGDSGERIPVTNPTGPQTDALLEVAARLKGAGASFPDVFYQEAVTGLRQVNERLDITYEAVGSAAGREAFAQGLSDFAGTDSLVGPDDGIAAGEFVYIPSTAASVAIVFNLPGVDNLVLDGPTIAGIFQRDITRWDHRDIAGLNPDADLPATPIFVARRSDGAGTTKNFTRYLEEAAPEMWRLGSGDTVEWPAATDGGQQNAGVAQLVRDAVGGIGYVDYGSAVELGLSMAAIVNSAGEAVAPSVEASTAAIDGAELADDLTYDPLFGPGQDAYPITAPTYLLVRATYDNGTTRDGVVAFVRWLITDGADTYAAELGYAPIPERFRRAALARLDHIEVA